MRPEQWERHSAQAGRLAEFHREGFQVCHSLFSLAWTLLDQIWSSLLSFLLLGTHWHLQLLSTKEHSSSKLQFQAHLLQVYTFKSLAGQDHHQSIPAPSICPLSSSLQEYYYPPVFSLGENIIDFVACKLSFSIQSMSAVLYTKNTILTIIIPFY